MQYNKNETMKRKAKPKTMEPDKPVSQTGPDDKNPVVRKNLLLPGLRRSSRQTKLQALGFMAAFAVVGSIMFFQSFALENGTISGVAFQDLNRNGVMDSGEAPWQSHQIYLFNASGTNIAVAYTDTSGAYSFNGLASGTYEVAYASPSWSALKNEWTPTTIGSYLPEKTITLAGAVTTVDFGWRKIIRSSDESRPIFDKTYSDGLRVQVYNDVVEPDILYNMLHKGSLVGAEKKSIILRLDLGQYTAAASSYGRLNDGTFCCSKTNINIDWTTWLNTGENALFHEWGHAWSNYFSVDIQQDPQINGYLQARGLYGDPRIDSSYGWSRYELIAEDYRQLFGSPVASAAGQANGSIPPARDVPGLLEYLRDTFTTPPSSGTLSAPTGVSAQAQATPEGPAVQLNWTASTSTNLSRYDIYRDNVLVGSANVPSTTYHDGAGLEPGKTYSYHIKAISSSGTQSPDSNKVSVTIPAADTQPPSTPSNLMTTSVTSASVSLAWNASSDNTGVTGYRVYRLGGKSRNLSSTLIGITTSLSFTDSGLKAGSTQGYYVTAIDAAGNQSTPTETLSVKLPRR
jgi:hypothetical protein